VAEEVEYNRVPLASYKGKARKQLIGKTLEWQEVTCRVRGYFRPCSGVIKELAGRNIHLDDLGSYDWHWMPTLICHKAVVLEPVNA
jgi:hypothetical protein